MENKNKLIFLKERLKQNQIKLTSARMAILDVLIRNKEEIDAEQVYMLAHKKDSTISLATVYRNLKMLAGIGLVARASDENGKSVYSLSGKLGSGAANKTSPAGHEQNSRSTDKDIYRIENQLNEALRDLNKIKLEKEIALEDVIKDFGRLDKILQAYELEENNLIQILLDIQEE